MKQLLKLMVAASLMMPCVAVSGQTAGGAKFEFVASGHKDLVQPSMLRTTNFNSSVCLDTNKITLEIDSLRTDGTATIITVYETEADGVVGLWQIGSGSNRALWLNSQSVSYDDFSIKYRSSTEKGVVIHTMTYQYPEVDKKYNGHDTLMLGFEDVNVGAKNLCALFYYPGILSGDKQRQMETVLAVRYGALLHGPYIDRAMKTIWNTIEADSAYSYGVCAIGRDDHYKLYQPKSVIRGDILTLESSSVLEDLDYVVLGNNGESLDMNGNTVLDGDKVYKSVARCWKLRARTGGDIFSVNLLADIDLPAKCVRLMLVSDNGSEMLVPSGEGTLAFKNVKLQSGRDYYLTLLVDNDIIENGDWQENSGERNAEMGHFASNISVTPNPTTGAFKLDVEQSDEDVVDVCIMDVNGRIVERFSTSEKVRQYTYNGSLQDGGVYYVTVSSNGRQKTIKLIVVR